MDGIAQCKVTPRLANKLQLLYMCTGGGAAPWLKYVKSTVTSAKHARRLGLQASSTDNEMS